MTYAQFLALFVVPVVLALAFWHVRRRTFSRRLRLALLATAVFAVVYTGPWDNLIIAEGVWGYPEARVIGPTIGLVPVEEYTFFILQVLLTGLLVQALIARDPGGTKMRGG